MWERLQGARVGGLWCGCSPSGGLGASAGCRPRSSVGVGDYRSPGGATAAGGNSPDSGRAAPAAAPSRPREAEGRLLAEVDSKASSWAETLSERAERG